MSIAPLFTNSESKQSFLDAFMISEFDFNRSMYSLDSLNSIYLDFMNRYDSLKKIISNIEFKLKECSKVHSSSARLKDPKHLIEKVIRKTNGKGTRFSSENYHQHITDLMGIRLLYVFKEDFPEIHDFIISNFGSKVIEKIACYRKGDKTQVYSEKGLDLQERNGYRSVHYVIDTGNHFCCEVQVRTLTEEAWGEMDHAIRYPYNKDDPKLTMFDDIMSNLTGTLDDLSSFAYNFLTNSKKNSESGVTFGQILTEFLNSPKVK